MFRCNDCGSIFEEYLAISKKQDYSLHNHLVCFECESEDIKRYFIRYEDLIYEYENTDDDEEREYISEEIKEYEKNYKGDRL